MRCVLTTARSKTEKLRAGSYNRIFDDCMAKHMDKDLLKGVALLLGVVVAVGAIFLLASNQGPRKAECIAHAIKSGVAYGKISKVCGLADRSY
jgi:hypothetical protein